MPPVSITKYVMSTDQAQYRQVFFLLFGSKIWGKTKYTE